MRARRTSPVKFIKDWVRLSLGVNVRVQEEGCGCPLGAARWREMVTKATELVVPANKRGVPTLVGRIRDRRRVATQEERAPTAVVMAINATAGRTTTHLLPTSLTRCQGRGKLGLDVLREERNTRMWT